MREYQESRDFIIQSIIRDIGFKSEEIKKVEAEVEKLLKLLDYRLESISGTDIVTATTLVAGVGDINRFRNSDKQSKQGNRELYGTIRNNLLPSSTANTGI